jgi:hypothetical protein
MKRMTRWKIGAVSAVTAAGLMASIGVQTTSAGADPGHGHNRHVLLISVDGLHNSDLAQCEANGACPNLAELAGAGTTYTNAKTSEPSDSAPGLMALVTGADPKLTGVYYDDAYDRTLYQAAAQTPSGTQNCSGPAGAETQYFENTDTNAPTFANGEVGKRPIMNASLDPTQFAYGIQNGVCSPVYPNNFLRTNSIFSVAHAAGMRTAWADKHPVYNQEVAGHGTPNAVDDPFNTEINADIIPPSLVDTRGRTVTFPVTNLDGTGPYFITDSVGDTESYDQVKVDAILNEIDGMNSAGTQSHVGEPNIFGMNFQTVSVAQKLVDPFESCKRVSPPPVGCDPNYVPGGYEPGSLEFTPQLAGAITSVDNAIGAMVAELQKQGELSSTTIIITAKHGQSPIDPSLLAKIGHAETTVVNNAGVNPAVVTDDDISLMWMKPAAQQSDTQKALDALKADKAGANTARISYILSGSALTRQFGDPTKDPRTPDLIVQPIPGTIYSTSKAKVAEHGGFSLDDTHVAMLVVNGADLARGRDNREHGGDVVRTPVTTYQVAPTVLQDLGLHPGALDSVQIEHVQPLPPAHGDNGQRDD